MYVCMCVYVCACVCICVQVCVCVCIYASKMWQLKIFTTSPLFQLLMSILIHYMFSVEGCVAIVCKQLSLRLQVVKAQKYSLIN